MIVVPAALQLEIRTNRSSAVGAPCHSKLAARHSIITIARHVFDLTVLGMFHLCTSGAEVLYRSVLLLDGQLDRK